MKKIAIIGFLITLMLLTISFATAINTNNSTNFEKKESPLFKVRTKLAIGEKIANIFKLIKIRHLKLFTYSKRAFFILQVYSPFNNLAIFSLFSFSSGSVIDDFHLLDPSGR